MAILRFNSSNIFYRHQTLLVREIFIVLPHVSNHLGSSSKLDILHPSKVTARRLRENGRYHLCRYISYISRNIHNTRHIYTFFRRNRSEDAVKLNHVESISGRPLNSAYLFNMFASAASLDSLVRSSSLLLSGRLDTYSKQDKQPT